MVEESPTNGPIKGVLKKKYGFEGAWKPCFCEFSSGELKIHSGLEDSPVETTIKITPSTVIHIVRDTLPTRFTIELENDKIYMFSTENSQDTNLLQNTKVFDS